AVLNRRPDLCAAAVLRVPFVDVINTMLDESLPLTVGEFEEWGNPKDRMYYDVMKTYDPYANLDGRRYPALLVRTSLNDSQVMYWEPAKYVARRRRHRGHRRPRPPRDRPGPARPRGHRDHALRRAPAGARRGDPAGHRRHRERAARRAGARPRRPRVRAARRTPARAAPAL